MALDPTDLMSYRVIVGSVCVPLREFLASCLGAADASPGATSELAERLQTLRGVFLEAGVHALERHTSSAADWLHVGIEPPSARGFRSEIYSHIARLVRRLLDDGAIDDFFFMDKPPGLRLRFRLHGGRSDTAAVVQAHLDRWRQDDAVGPTVPGVYEPETQLFGGPVSMRWVHALFTCDSLAWLDYHAHGLSEASPGAPAWVLSLAMLRELFQTLGIDDWEDLDVWDRIRRRAGRSLPGDRIAEAGLTDAVQDIAVEIRGHWAHPTRLLDELPPVTHAILKSFSDGVAPVAAAWQTEYLSRPDATLGRRAVAALLTIFHWNRAGLPLARQALLADALATRETI